MFPELVKDFFFVFYNWVRRYFNVRARFGKGMDLKGVEDSRWEGGTRTKVNMHCKMLLT